MSRGLIVSVGGVKDGVGKTLFAANLAISIFREINDKVLYIDGDIDNCGDAHIIFGEEKIPSISSLLPQLKGNNPEQVLDTVPKSTKAGLHLLKLYESVNELATIDQRLFALFFRFLKSKFRLILIDAGSHFTPFNIKAYEFSSLIFFLVTPDVMTLAQAPAKLQLFQNAQISKNLINIIFNQFQQGGAITPQIVAKKLQKEVLLTIPFDPGPAQKSLYEGSPLVISQPRSNFSACINQLSAFLLKDSVINKLPHPNPDDQIDLENLKGLNPTLLVSGLSEAGGARKVDLFKVQTKEEFDRETEFKLKVHKRLIEIMDLKKIETEAEAAKDEQKVAEFWDRTRDVINKIIDDIGGSLTMSDRKRISKEVLDEALGLGPLEDLLADQEINEIMINHKDQIYIEKSGRLQLTNCRFSSDKHLRTILDRIVQPTGRRIDEKSPYVDSRLRDGSRVHAIIPPLALKGATITIRKFKKEKMTYRDLVKYGTITDQMADFLRAVIEAKLNCIISGGTGTGKTTLLNIVAGFIPPTDRIVTVEDSAELQLPQEHVVTLETRPANLQGEGEVSIRDLVRNSLRMRPDRIVVGECRGPEALDMLQAMNTGHDGSLTTLHSNNPRDCIGRLETLVMFAGYDMPSRAIREQIASAVDMIIQLNRMSDGSRRVTHVTEITGIESNMVTLQDIFLYKQTGVDSKGKAKGVFQATGLIPKFVQSLKEKGIRLPQGIFTGSMEV